MGEQLRDMMLAPVRAARPAQPDSWVRSLTTIGSMMFMITMPDD